MSNLSWFSIKRENWSVFGTCIYGESCSFPCSLNSLMLLYVYLFYFEFLGNLEQAKA